MHMYIDFISRNTDYE